MTRVARPAPAQRRDLTRSALRTFFSITARWGLTTEQERCLLGSPGRSTFFRWKRDHAGAVPGDALERISYVQGICQDLRMRCADEAQAGWIRQPNAAPPFGGEPPLDRMLAGRVADLYVVRVWLAAQRR